MTVTEDDLTLAKKVARHMAGKWSAVEYDDLASELTLWLFENEKYVDRYRSHEDGRNLLTASLQRYAAKYCAKEQSMRTGAPLDHDEPYTLQQVRRAMPCLFDGTIPETRVAEHPQTGEPLHETGSGGLAMAILMDLRLAFDAQPSDVKEMLEMQYRDGLTYAEIAAILGVSKRTAIRRGGHALASVRERLSGHGS